VIQKNSEDFLFGSNFAITDDTLVDFKSNIFYKGYKITQEEALNKMPVLFKNIQGIIIVVKTQNYLAEIFAPLHKNFVMKEFQTQDYLSKTEEEIETSSNKIYNKFKKYDALYNDFSEELKQVTNHIKPKKVVYVFVPLKIGLKPNKIKEVQLKYKKEKEKYFKEYNDMTKGIEKLSFLEYNKRIQELKIKNNDISKYLYENIILPSLDIYNTQTDEEQNITAQNKNTIMQLETEAKLYTLTGTDEITGLFNSFLYESIYFGDKYMTMVDVYNELIAPGRNGEKYFDIIKPLIKNFDYVEISNNSTIVSSVSKSQIYFVAGTKTMTNYNENFMKYIDDLSGNFDIILKIQEINKDELISYIDNKIKIGRLKLSTIISKEEESPRLLEAYREEIKNNEDYYLKIKNKLLDNAEKAYSVGEYAINHLIFKNQLTEFVNDAKKANLEIRLLPPSKKETLKLFDLSYDTSGFFIHSKPLFHIYNVYQIFKNVNIITTDDNSQISKMKELSKTNRWLGEA
jgi:hypothetical protein